MTNNSNGQRDIWVVFAIACVIAITLCVAYLGGFFAGAEDPEAILAIANFIVTIVFFFVTARFALNAQTTSEKANETSNKALRTSIQPILVFSRREHHKWQLHNVGNGPALNVVFRGTKKEETEDTALYPIAAGSLSHLDWNLHGDKLEVWFTDAHGVPYKTTCVGRPNNNAFEELDTYPDGLEPNRNEYMAKKALDSNA
ncbi:MAG: hypothetical protein ACI8P0_000927 [Planctomycetaceae bacterium]|jgi:hypothetical protein